MEDNEQKTKKNKDGRLEIRLSHDDLEMIKSKAAKMSLTSSEMIRRLAKYGVCYKVDFNVGTNILYELGKIGNNINQIARGLNTSIIKNEQLDGSSIKQSLDLYYKDLHALQKTCEEYFADNSIKQLEKIKIED